MDVVVLAPSERAGLMWQYAVEDLGADWRCLPVIGAEQAALRLRTWADALLLLPGGESGHLLRRLAENPPLAPPYILGSGAPDGTLPEAAALPERLASFRRTLKLPALSSCHLSATEDIAGALLRILAVPGGLRAWSFLPEMCALTVVHPPLLTDLQHGLYPLVAAKYGMTAGGVERSLRLCVESTWMHGSLAALDRFFGASVDPEKGKPTNREFLCRMQERLTLSMQRLVG